MSLLPRYAATVVRPISQSRYHFRFWDPSSDILYGTLICWYLLCGRWRRIHKNCHCHSSEWDTIKTFLPNVTYRVLPPIYYQHPHRPAYLMPSSSVAKPIIQYIFCFPCFLASLPHLFFWYLNLPVSLMVYLLPYLPTVPGI